MRKAWLLVGVVAIWWWMRGGEVAHPHRLQAAVLAEGFASLADKRVVIYDRDAEVRGELQLAQDGDVRIVGTRSGVAIGWRDGTKVKIGLLDGDGRAKDVSTWGKKAVALCDGVASNEHRFGVGWLESNGTVWFVHGPTQRTALPSVAKASWCALASADQNVALLWRDGQRLLLNFCTRKECTKLVVKVPIDPKETLLGFGCINDACLFATRDKAGTTKLHRVTERGRAVVKTLDAASDSPVTVIGVGARGFAVGYVGRDGYAGVRRVAADGSLGDGWYSSALRTTPALAWAGGKLFITTRELAYAIDFPQ